MKRFTSLSGLGLGGLTALTALLLLSFLVVGEVFGQGQGRKVMSGPGGEWREYQEAGPLRSIYPIRGTVVTATNTTTASTALQCYDWGRLQRTIYSDSSFSSYTSSAADSSTWYYVRVAGVDDIADQELIGRYSVLVSLTNTGVATVRPALTDDAGSVSLDAGDEVEIVPWSAIHGYGGTRFHGYAISGDSMGIVFSDLIGKEDVIQVGSIIRCVDDADATTNDGKTARVYSFTASTGEVRFIPSWHTAVAVLDEFIIEAAPEIDIGTEVSVTSENVFHKTSGSYTFLSGYGPCRINFLSGRVTVVLGATGNQVVKLWPVTGTGAQFTIASSTATGSDAWGTIYSIALDTTKALQKETVHQPYYVWPAMSAFNIDAPALTQCGYLVTPDSAWTLVDSAQSTAGAGKITWTANVTLLGNRSWVTKANFANQ